MEFEKKEEKLTYSDLKDLKKHLHISLGLEYLAIIDDYRENNPDCRSTTDAITKLIKSGYILWKNKDKIAEMSEDSELLAELKSQYHEGGLVDFAQKMSPKQFEIFYSIMNNENKSRQYKK